MKNSCSASRTILTATAAFAVWFASVACMLTCLTGCRTIAGSCGVNPVTHVATQTASADDTGKPGACCHRSKAKTCETAEAENATATPVLAAEVSEHHDTGECCALAGRETRFLTSPNVSPDSHAVTIQTPFFLLPPKPTVARPEPVFAYLPCRGGTHLKNCVFLI
jgi:hypothetical protein